MLVVTFALGVVLSIPQPPVAVDKDTKAKLQSIAFQAAREGDAKTLAAYFAAGFPVDEANARGDTLLCVAAYGGELDSVTEILKQKSVTVDARNRMGLTALAAAAFKGHVDIAKALVDRKADVNAANESGQTALMFAALTGRTEMVKYLLKVGADPSAADKSGNTAASLARGQRAVAAAELIESAAKKPKP